MMPSIKPPGAPRPVRMRLSFGHQDIERIRIAAAKAGLNANTWVRKIAIEASLRAA